MTPLHRNPCCIRMPLFTLCGPERCLNIFRRHLYSLLQHLISTKVATSEYGFLQLCHLALLTGRQHSQTHHLDQANVFPLDMMKLFMRMVYAQRMLLGSNIIAQHQIQLILLPSFSRNGSDGIVRFSVSLRIDKGCFIGIASP